MLGMLVMVCRGISNKREDEEEEEQEEEVDDWDLDLRNSGITKGVRSKGQEVE
jgi:hypothetical protein